MSMSPLSACLVAFLHKFVPWKWCYYKDDARGTAFPRQKRKRNAVPPRSPTIWPLTLLYVCDCAEFRFNTGTLILTKLCCFKHDNLKILTLSKMLQLTTVLRVSFSLELTRGQSNLTKSASRGAHSPVRGHPRGSKFVPLNSWGRVSY